jgi:hypothetical protein
VLFVHVPKTGGATIDVMFKREVTDARLVGDLARHSPYNRILQAEPGLADYWSFGFVRNPWARMVSWWSMVRKVFEKADAGNVRTLRKLRDYPEVWLPSGEYRDDFAGFVLEGTLKMPKVARPQLRTLTTPRGRQVDFIGRTEHFDRDLAIVRQRLGLPPFEPVPRRNATSHGHYSEYYDDRTRARVAEVFADDIEAFGYTFDEG